MDLSSPPERYWHCSVKISGKKGYSVVNDLSFQELERTIVSPWNAGRTFTVAGTLIRSTEAVEAIKITHTDQPRSYYADRHNARMHASGIADMATNRSLLPLSQGTDLTYELLFSGAQGATLEPDVKMVEQLCKRLPQAARILAVRSRAGK